jgi:O-antigen ligase
LVVALVIGAVFAKGWRRPFVAFLGLGVAGVIANAPRFFSSDRSSGGIGSSNEIYDRLNIMATSLKAIGEHPFLGVGIGRFRVYNTHEHTTWSPEMDWNRGFGIISHQNELGIAAELGIPGVLLWISVVVGVLWLLWRAVRDLPQDSFLGTPLAVVGGGAMAILVTNALTVDLRILDFASMLPFLLAGMVVGQLERQHAGRLVRPAGSPGSGLPGGMSGVEQAAWEEEYRAGRARDDARSADARATPGSTGRPLETSR